MKQLKYKHIDTLKKKLFFSIFIIQLSSTASFAINTDSIRIVTDLNKRFKKVHSGKIYYERSTKSFFRSTPSITKSYLTYTSSPFLAFNPVVYLDRKIISTQNGIHDEAIFYSDTDYETNEKLKEIPFSIGNPDDFIDSYDDAFWMFSFGFYPKNPSGLFNVTGHYIFTDTIVNGDSCYKITNKTMGDGETIDSSLQVWIISINDCRHTSYHKTSWGYGGNASEFLQTCTEGQYSEDYDSLLLQKVKARIFSLVHDSGYILKNYSDQTLSDTKSPQKVKLKKEDFFPVLHFQTIDGADVDISNPSSKVTLLDFSYMGCEPCRQAISSISRIYNKFKDSNVAILGIDPYDQKEKEIFERYSKKYHLDYPVLFSDKKTVFDELGISSFPTFLILDKNMKLRQKFGGWGPGFNRAGIDEEISKLLREQ